MVLFEKVPLSLRDRVLPVIIALPVVLGALLLTLLIGTLSVADPARLAAGLHIATTIRQEYTRPNLALLAGSQA